MQVKGITPFFRDVVFTNPQTGWAVGSLGTIVKTSNGGDASSTQVSALCKGTFITVGDTTYGTQGVFTRRILRPGKCDSMVQTTVQVISPKQFSQSIVLCPGQSIAVADTSYATTGTFLRKTKSSQGCDSSIITSIYVSKSDTTILRTSCCQGQSVLVGSQSFSQQGVFNVTLKNKAGCDSLVTLFLTVIPPKTGFRSFTTCEGTPIEDAGKVFKEEGKFETTLTARSTNCDSIHVTEIIYIKLRLKTTPDTLVEFEQPIQIHAFSPGTNLVYRWEPEDVVSCAFCTITLTDTIRRNTNFTVTVTDTVYQCSQQNSFKAKVVCPFLIPNLVTINEDGRNDFLYIQPISCLKKIKSFQLFNRWGKEIFLKSDYLEISGIPLWPLGQEDISSGTYFYRLQTDEFANEIKSYSGWIEVSGEK